MEASVRHMIEDHAYIGTGAVIKQSMPSRPVVIGRGAIVGMGAVVTKSVAPGITVVGNPARSGRPRRSTFRTASVSLDAIGRAAHRRAAPSRGSHVPHRADRTTAARLERELPSV